MQRGLFAIAELLVPDISRPAFSSPVNFRDTFSFHVISAFLFGPSFSGPAFQSTPVTKDPLM